MSWRVLIIALLFPLAGTRPPSVSIQRAAAFDTSPPLVTLRNLGAASTDPACDHPAEGCGVSPREPDDTAADHQAQPAALTSIVPRTTIEQTAPGARPSAALIASFDGLGFGFTGPQGPATSRNPSDNSLAAGPNHIVELAGGRMAVYDKKGAVLYGAVSPPPNSASSSTASTSSITPISMAAPSRPRWMASIGMDRRGNIGVGYSFGAGANFAGQRFAARLAGDPKGRLTLKETVLVEGKAAQNNTLRWEDYATTAMDPSDDCTFWYVGDYLKAGATGYTTRIGAFRIPGCR
jgi:hypothetical protein